MTLVDVSEVSATLFILGVIFLLLIFGLLSFGIVRMFQQRFRAGWLCIGGAALSTILFVVILNQWFV
ncbi:hypothetical protein ACFO9Q_11585 [Paenibacillus sp. GCM10023252]|uniref:hypothetical protein n=1 Tax=Paenibacillus sp. GCM10023252 TaxID=3252649 RepID=UPI003608935C